jgi:hypothetical protein
MKADSNDLTNQIKFYKEKLEKREEFCRDIEQKMEAL